MDYKPYFSDSIEILFIMSGYSYRYDKNGILGLST